MMLHAVFSAGRVPRQETADYEPGAMPGRKHSGRGNPLSQDGKSGALEEKEYADE